VNGTVSVEELEKLPNVSKAAAKAVAEHLAAKSAPQ
jgi:DNA uptake protein ComE-like DNA-binding protein